MTSQWKMESQRKMYGKALVELGKANKDIVVLDSDLSSSTQTAMFAEVFPERFFNCGIAEANMMDTAAGLAASGKTVFASTFAVFGTGRCYDQIRQSIAYARLNVKIVVSHAGITVGGDGASHQITEDIALMRALPNMAVIVPADAPETYRTIMEIVNCRGPVYVRMGRADVPSVTEGYNDFKIGTAMTMTDGADVTLVGTGIMVSRCLMAAEELKRRGISARVLNMSTIKPLDERAIIKSARETGAIVTAEEHSVLQGLGAAVALTVCENTLVPMRRVGMPDVFGESGDCEELMVKYGLTAENIVNAAHDVLSRKR